MQVKIHLFGLFLLIIVRIPSLFSQAEIWPNGILVPHNQAAGPNQLYGMFGQFVFNDLDSNMYYFDGTSWTIWPKTNLSDRDSDTGIEFEKAADDDIIRLMAGGREVVRVRADQNGRERIEIANADMNTMVGDSSGSKLVSGGQNVFLGHSAGQDVTEAIGNVFIGSQAGKRKQTGLFNTWVGMQSGSESLQGQENAFFGAFTGINNGGNRNTFVGTAAGNENMEGSGNTFTGALSGLSNNDGNSNSFYGNDSGRGLNAGDRNVFIGSEAGRHTTVGSENTFVGAKSGFNYFSGEHNTFFGTSSGISSRKGNNNTLIGSNTDFRGTDSLNNAIAIGHSAQVGCSNCAVIGGIDSAAVQVGIGVSTPEFPLVIQKKADALRNNLVRVPNLNVVISKGESIPNEATGIGFQSSKESNDVGAAIIHERTGLHSVGKMHFATKDNPMQGVDIPIKMTLSENGFLGVGQGALNPLQNLHVLGKSAASIRLEETNQNGGAGIWDISSNGSSFALRDVLRNRLRMLIRASATEHTLMSLGGTRDFEIRDLQSGAFSYIQAGDLGFTVSSSRSLKRDISEATTPADLLRRIAAVKVKEYHWKHEVNELDKGKQMGMIAEEFHEILRRGDTSSINSHEVIMVLWMAVQELSSKIGVLERELEQK